MDTPYTLEALTARMRGYIFGMGVFWLLLIWALLKWGYVGSFVHLNPHDAPWVDAANMYIFTHLGEGFIMPALLLLFMWKEDPALPVAGIVAMLLTGLVCQLLKHGVFDDWDRPPVVLEGVMGLSFPDPHLLKHNSFPSGHSTSMGAGGVFFAYFLGKYHRALPWVVAGFTAYLCSTRTLLGVHFPGDLLAGSALGVTGGVLVLWLLYPRLTQVLNRGWLHQRSWLRDGVLGLALLALFAQYTYQILTRL